MKFIFLPEDSDTEAMYVFSKWYVDVGDQVKVGDTIGAYEQDKSVVDVVCDVDGTLAEAYVQAEDVVAPGSKICGIEEVLP